MRNDLDATMARAEVVTRRLAELAVELLEGRPETWGEAALLLEEACRIEERVLQGRWLH